MNYKIEHRTLHFKQPAGTSRGVYTTRDVWYIHLYDGERHCIGECAPLPDLSCDAFPHEEYEQYLHAACTMYCQTGKINYALLRDYPSILFGLEMVDRKSLSPNRPTPDRPTPDRPTPDPSLIGRGVDSLVVQNEPCNHASQNYPNNHANQNYPNDHVEQHEPNDHVPQDKPSTHETQWEDKPSNVTTPLPTREGSGVGLPGVGLRINGLIWMGTYEEMKARLEEKLAAGYHCIKLKIGAINFEDELALIKRIREEYPPEKVELRVDANGAFGTSRPSPHPSFREGVDSTAGKIDLKSVIDKLQRLAQYDIHSIEQPIRQGHWEEMAKLCKLAAPQQTDVTTPLPMGEGSGVGLLPIALDEELIGINTTAQKIELLDTIRPQYIILKPMLHGGFSGCDEWIRLAEERGIGWWATSALESNVGLAAIARWVAQYHPTMPQGLGTGLLYTDNTPPETEIRGDELWLL